MKIPKSRCTIVLMGAGILAGIDPAVAAESKSSRDIADYAAGAVVRDAPSSESAATKTRPTAPSNVRIKVQTSPAAHAASVPTAAATDPVLVPTGRSRAPVAAALDAQNFASALRAATAASRGKVLEDADSRVTAAEGALNVLEKSVPEMSADGRQQFKITAADARDKATALRKSMDAARRATSEEWESARGQVAADYHAYAAALARIDSAMGVTPAAR